MHVLTPGPDHTITTPNAVMTTLASPSRGSSALSTWQVRMEAGAQGPEHRMDQEQVWTVMAGSLTVRTGDRTETVATGQTLVVPADTPRRFTAGDAGTEALVAMPAGGQVSVPGGEKDGPLPWAV